VKLEIDGSYPRKIIACYQPSKIFAFVLQVKSYGKLNLDHKVELDVCTILPPVFN
jgi:hypothetical protein